jgi:predicted GNAT superfamily acetyltransferase
MTVMIRDLKSYDEMVKVRQLQREIWGWAETDIGLYPAVLNTAARNGGVVLGAFDEKTGQMVGFLFSFLGREPGGPLKLCSQVMGVRKEWRGQGLGKALKQAQRERALAQDLPLITWTFDPLEAPNARLNLYKLRAICRTYYRDVYGSDFGALNAGLPTDRLLVEWWVGGGRVAAKPGVNRAELLAGERVFLTEGRGVARQIRSANLNLDADRVLLEIPVDVQQVKAVNMDLARDWRMQVRQAFENYLARGYIAADFLLTLDQGERRASYLLQRSSPELLAEIGITG